MYVLSVLFVLYVFLSFSSVNPEPRTPNWPGYITAALTLSGKIALSRRMWLSTIDRLHTLAGYDTFGGLLNFSRGLLLYPTPKYQFTQVFQEYLAFSPTYLAEVTAGLCF